MRTALVLLFLLAVAALPGALLPQRSLNQRLVAQYFADHPALAPVLDRLQFFDVFAAPWFAAVYLLLMVSLVGCLLPRTVEQVRGLRTPPVATPRNLARLPARGRADRRRSRSRGRGAGARPAARLAGGGPTSRAAVRAVSAERGQLREVGNLVFHLSLLGLLVAFAAGKLFGYEGQVIVLSGGGQFCNTGILGYDSFRAGLRVDGTDLDPFCVRVDDFTATCRTARRTATGPTSATRPPRTSPPGGDEWRPTRSGQPPAAVRRHPGLPARPRLRPPVHRHLPGRRPSAPARSSGAVDPAHPAVRGRHEVQPGWPTRSSAAPASSRSPGCSPRPAPADQLVTSVFPALRDAPEVAVDVLRGDLGLTTGAASRSSTVAPDRRPASWCGWPGDLVPGRLPRLDDGTTVRFDGCAVGVAAGQPRSRAAGDRARLRSTGAARARALAVRQAPPVLGAARRCRGGSAGTYGCARVGARAD